MFLPPVLRTLSTIFTWESLYDTQQTILLRYIVGYILRIYSFIELRKNLRFLKPRQILDCREKMTNDWNLAVALRLAIYTIAQKQIKNRKKIISIFIEHGLKPDDATIYFNLVTNGDIMAVQQRAYFLQIPSIAKLRTDCAELIKSQGIKQYVEKFVNKKLRAFAHSNNLTVKDFENELLAEGVRCYFNTIPNLSGQHLLNYIKVAIKRRGHDLISYYRAGRRLRLIPESEMASGFTNTIRTIDGIVEDCEPDRYLGINEMYIDYNNLLLKYSDGKRRALRLMGLDDDLHFIEWWNRQHRKSQRTTTDIFYQHDTPEDYINTIRRFIGVNTSAFAAWLAEFR